jgi:tetratricopeptide (TPR) repeat protein
MKYAVLFVVAALTLTLGAMLTFERITTSRAAVVEAPAFPRGDTLPASAVRSPVMPTRKDYAAFAAEDSVWRAQHARSYSIADLRQRGDGRPTARDLMQDRVFGYTKHGRRGQAIAELEKWVAAHPLDDDALLSLARLLNADGRADAAVARYRQVLALRDSK